MLGIAIVGLRRGMSLARVFAARDDCRVVAVCGLEAAEAREAAEQLDAELATDDYEQVLTCGAVDAVVLATPPPMHASGSIAALRAGKHVLSEVPAVWRLEEAPELVKAARGSAAVYMMAENMAYFAWVQSFEEMVRAEFIGEPVYAECEYIHDLRGAMVAPEPRLAYDERGRTWRGAIGPAQYCTHDLGPILRMFDDRVESVVGMNTGAWIMRREGVIDAEVILCRTAGRRVIKFLASFVNARGGSLHYFSIYGTEGVLESPRFEGQPYMLRSSRIPHTRGWVQIPLTISHPHLEGRIPSGGHGTSEWLMVDDFVRACRGEAPPTVDVYTALDWSLPGLVGHMSAQRSGQPLGVPDPRTW